jgi:hypothetical protein
LMIFATKKAWIRLMICNNKTRICEWFVILRCG